MPMSAVDTDRPRLVAKAVTRTRTPGEALTAARRVVSVAVLAVLCPCPALAWGDAGHRATVAIAEPMLTSAARRVVAELIASSALLATPGCPLRSLADASVWPDCVRAIPQRFDFARRWHYVNVSICSGFTLQNACPPGDCIVAQIERLRIVVGDTARPRRERLEALAFLVHFIGDLHQPLHVGENDDRGGNEIRVRYPGRVGDRLNLHRIWDTELAEETIVRTGGPRRLRRLVTPAQRTAWAHGDVQAWARESWSLSAAVVYPGIGRHDICRRGSPAAATITPGYVDAAVPVVRVQLQRAGVRLAAVLNAVLR